MANIHDRRNKLATLGLARLGKDIFVVGVPYKAIISDDDYEDETGERRELLASFDFSLAKIIKRGDSVVYEGEMFTIGKQQRENSLDQFYTVELKRA